MADSMEGKTLRLMWKPYSMVAQTQQFLFPGDYALMETLLYILNDIPANRSP